MAEQCIYRRGITVVPERGVQIRHIFGQQGQGLFLFPAVQKAGQRCQEVPVIMTEPPGLFDLAAHDSVLFLHKFQLMGLQKQGPVLRHFPHQMQRSVIHHDDQDQQYDAAGQVNGQGLACLHDVAVGWLHKKTDKRKCRGKSPRKIPDLVGRFITDQPSDLRAEIGDGQDIDGHLHQKLQKQRQQH